MVSVFGWSDPNTGFDQSEHALHTCYFIKFLPFKLHILLFEAEAACMFVIKGKLRLSLSSRKNQGIEKFCPRSNKKAFT
jgi:hypothetical protein